METINFYYTTDRFGDFSNFALFPIILDGLTWATAEHYYQAQKFENEQDRQAIREATTPMQAAKLARARNLEVRADWALIKDNIMRNAVFAKFSQHERLRLRLLSTGNAVIVEHTKNDSYWGDGGDGSGRNMLGRILMEVRVQVRDSSQTLQR